MLALLLACAEPPPPPAAELRATNVLIVTVDTLRADALGCMGTPGANTPNLDAFASSAALFLDHTSAATTTLPAHASLFTGLYPNRHGVAHNGYRLLPGPATLAEILSGAGFATAGFVSALPLRRRFGLDRGFAVWDEPPGGRVPDERDAAEVTDAALGWLLSAPEGWFAFVHYWDPHAPYAPPERVRIAQEDPAVTGSFADISRARAARAAGAPDAGLERDLRARYAAEVAHVDAELGRLLGTLESAGRLRDALIVITADHGESMGEHEELFDHGYTVFQEAAHTPLIVRAPGAMARRLAEPVSQVDIAPTVLRALGLPVPPEMQGKSLISLLLGQADVPHTPLFVEANRPQRKRAERGAEGWPNLRKCAGARDGARKLIRCPRTGFEALYDLVVDPGETKSLLGFWGAGGLGEALDAWSLGRPAGLERVDDAATEAALEALGYIEPADVKP